jgi:DNA polymerase-1
LAIGGIINLQTMPRSTKVVKRAFVPKLGAFVFADYSNIELRLLAMYLASIGHPSMVHTFVAGADLHTETARGVLGLTPDLDAFPKYGISDEARQVGKTMNFSIVYGGGMPTLMKQLGVTAPEALELLRTYHNTWPGIGWETKRKKAAEGTLIRTLLAQVEARTQPGQPGYIKTLYGRHLHPRAAHSTLNALCQGCAADLKKWAMVQCYRGLRDGGFQTHLVNEVHDELMFDAPVEELPEVCALIPEWMTDPRIQDIIDIKPECEVSYTSWADKEDWHG